MVFGNDAGSVPSEIRPSCCETTESSDNPTEATRPELLGGYQTP
jgi:hypothetical protein